MSFRRTVKAVATAASILAMGAQSALACTGIILHSEDGATVFGRTLEFAVSIGSQLQAIPAGTTITTLAADPDHTGFSYTTKYGFVGMNAFDMPIAVDAMNTEGLHFGAFFFAGPADFPAVTAGQTDKAISSEELGNWVLGNFATVAELRGALPDQVLVGTTIEQLGGVAPLHYSVVDASGDAVVIEQTSAGLIIHDNTVNVIANNPPFDWHLTNLRNYIGLTDKNHPAITLGRQTLEPFGEGTGLAGLPGNGTSPARFVRAAAFANTAEPMEKSSDAVFGAFHILNNFDIPVGSVRGEHDGKVQLEFTEWTSVADTAAQVYYYKTYEGQTVTKVDVKAALDGLDAPKTVPLEKVFKVTDQTGSF